MGAGQTVEDSSPGDRREPPVPGFLILFSGEAPLLHALPVRAGETLHLGRDNDAKRGLADERLSRHHAELALAHGHFIITDLKSRNGTFVDGERVDGEAQAEPGSLLRLGHTVGLLLGDLGPFDDAKPLVKDRVSGPALRGALERVRRAAQSADCVLLVGESGSGKELAAREFHQAGPHQGGPFVAINCAAIPEGVAERLLFGARRGAYSGAAADAEGYLQAAHNGVLFLDEIAELDLTVQAKLLRVLETREVMQLGASVAKKVELRICCATHRNLRAAVAAGKFRADLFYRIAQSEVLLPPLRERRDEIPWLVSLALGDNRKVKPSAKLVEQCMLRRWPGNVRELLAAIRRAADRAAAEASPVIRPEHLDPNAGMAMGAAGPAADEAAPISRAASPARTLDRAAVEEALTTNGGNIAQTARTLGLHRTQLYRLMKRFGIDAGSGGGDPDGGDPEPS